jgi:PAS domain S-box-containing protein
VNTARGRHSARPARSRELAELRRRLGEAEGTLHAIRTGEVDAVVTAGKAGLQVFTLQGADHVYRVLIESMNEGALTLTEGSMVLYANACFARLVQRPLETVIGGSVRRFLSAQDGAALRLLVRRAGRTGSKIQVALHAADGSTLPVQISLRRLERKGPHRAPVGLVVTDLTESRRAAHQAETARLYAQVCAHAAELERRVDERTAQLQSANRELESFQSSVSHDLRAPLRHVTGFSQILLDFPAAQLPDGARDYLLKIHECAGKMDRMIVALLEFSRLSNQALSPQPVDIGRTWREILAELRPELGDRPLDVTIGDLPPCHADPALLHHVLVNLLENALKYSRLRDRAVIQISAATPAGSTVPVYSIKDNGVGFDMAQADKLFTVFARLHSTNDFEGTGVGLTTAHRIIQRHGGRIWAESAPGLGATFYFHVGPPPPPPPGGADPRPVKAKTSARLRPGRAAA